MVWSHEVAHLQMFVAVWRSQKRVMQSFSGFLHWQVRPRGLACPFAVGACCWLIRDMGGHTPPAVLDSLVVLQVKAAEAWCAPCADVQTICLKLGLRRWWGNGGRARGWFCLWMEPMMGLFGESEEFWSI